MITKADIEKRIRLLQQDAHSLGLEIATLSVLDERVIHILEQCDIGPLGIKRKPIFFSAHNYHFKAKDIDQKVEYGKFEGIRFMKKNV